MIEFLGQLIGFLFLGAIIYLLWKHKGTHPELFKLTTGEEIVEMVKGDYWIKEFLWREQQNTGEIAFTNRRILFKGTMLNSSDKDIKIPYSKIADIKKSNIVLFIPMAFTVITTDNEAYKFAVMKRNHYIDLIKSLAQKSKEELETIQ
ncbi:MAG: GRAM domain-containing protein [Fusobacterium sp.]|nr:GRAM domain-containing protein [Fusobacterium sp.]